MAAAWRVPQASQQPLEEARGNCGIPAILDQDDQHHPVLIDRPPEVMQRTVNPQLHLSEVPGILWLRPTLAQLLGELGTAN